MGGKVSKEVLRRHRARRITIKVTPLEDARLPERKSKGKRTGLGVCEYVALLFDTNERLTKDKKMTDATIQKLLTDEYPDRKALTASGVVAKYRSHYNAGRLIGKPTVYSFRYDSKGNVIPPRRGRKPKAFERPELTERDCTDYWIDVKDDRVKGTVVQPTPGKKIVEPMKPGQIDKIKRRMQ